jgi:hypothetical protein
MNIPVGHSQSRRINFQLAMLEASHFLPPACHYPVPFQLSPLLSQLSLSDQAEFIHLVANFASSEDRNKRNLGLSTFVKHLGIIHSFVCRGDAQDALRGAVCGIEFGEHSFLINTRQLKKLMFRSKSCMNGCFQRLGYTVCRSARDLGTVFSRLFPLLSPQSFSSRQWCVRRAGESSVVSFSPNLNLEIASVEPAEVSSAHPFDIGNLLNHPAAARKGGEDAGKAGKCGRVKPKFMWFVFEWRIQ